MRLLLLTLVFPRSASCPLSPSGTNTVGARLLPSVSKLVLCLTFHTCWFSAFSSLPYPFFFPCALPSLLISFLCYISSFPYSSPIPLGFFCSPSPSPSPLSTLFPSSSLALLFHIPHLSCSSALLPSATRYLSPLPTPPPPSPPSPPFLLTAPLPPPSPIPFPPLPSPPFLLTPLLFPFPPSFPPLPSPILIPSYTSPIPFPPLHYTSPIPFPPLLLTPLLTLSPPSPILIPSYTSPIPFPPSPILIPSYTSPIPFPPLTSPIPFPPLLQNRYSEAVPTHLPPEKTGLSVEVLFGSLVCEAAATIAFSIQN